MSNNYPPSPSPRFLSATTSRKPSNELELFSRETEQAINAVLEASRLESFDSVTPSNSTSEPLSTPPTDKETTNSTSYSSERRQSLAPLLAHGARSTPNLVAREERREKQDADKHHHTYHYKLARNCVVPSPPRSRTVTNVSITPRVPSWSPSRSQLDPATPLRRKTVHSGSTISSPSTSLATRNSTDASPSMLATSSKSPLWRSAHTPNDGNFIQQRMILTNESTLPPSVLTDLVNSAKRKKRVMFARRTKADGDDSFNSMKTGDYAVHEATTPLYTGRANMKPLASVLKTPRSNIGGSAPPTSHPQASTRRSELNSQSSPGSRDQQPEDLRTPTRPPISNDRTPQQSTSVSRNSTHLLESSPQSSTGYEEPAPPYRPPDETFAHGWTSSTYSRGMSVME
ncbi:hypothetical protein FRC03_005463 [Tulasnella sp. 419]|nr:hypothetical protein FRC03_005463 [Tulasnella sp. 419]